MKTTIKLLLLYVATQILATSIINFFVYSYFTLQNYISTGMFQITSPSETGNLYSIILTLLLSNIFFCWYLIHGQYVPTDKKTWSAYSLPVMLMIIPLTLSSMLWMNYAVESLPLDDRLETLFNHMNSNILGIVSISIVAPIMEEMLFRGAIEGSLLKAWKHPSYAIIVSALIFGLIHGNPIQIPFAFVHGLILGWLFYKTGSLLPGILLHFINNSISTALGIILPQSSQSMEMIFGKANSIILSISGLIITVISIYIINRLTQKSRIETEEIQK